MTITNTKIKSVKSQKAREFKKAKTSAMLFFLTCLDEAVDINKLEEFASLQHLSFDEQQKLVQAFKNLPHPELMFYQTINTYRSTRILKILDENINPVHLKKFSRTDSAEKNSKENKIECQLILKMIESNRENYREVLQLFIESFEKNIKIKWEKSEPDLLEQHLEKQKKLFAQKNAEHKISEVEQPKDIQPIVQPVPVPSKSTTATNPKKFTSSQPTIAPVSNIENNLVTSLTTENEKLAHVTTATTTTPVTTSSHSVINKNDFQSEVTQTITVATIEEKPNQPKNVATETAASFSNNQKNDAAIANSPKSESILSDPTVTSLLEAKSQSTLKDSHTEKLSDESDSEKLSIYEIAAQSIAKNPKIENMFDTDAWF